LAFILQKKCYYPPMKNDIFPRFYEQIFSGSGTLITTLIPNKGLYVEDQQGRLYPFRNINRYAVCVLMLKLDKTVAPLMRKTYKGPDIVVVDYKGPVKFPQAVQVLIQDLENGYYTEYSGPFIYARDFLNDNIDELWMNTPSLNLPWIKSYCLSSNSIW